MTLTQFHSFFFVFPPLHFYRLAWICEKLKLIWYVKQQRKIEKWMSYFRTSLLLVPMKVIFLSSFCSLFFFLEISYGLISLLFLVCAVYWLTNLMEFEGFLGIIIFLLFLFLSLILFLMSYLLHHSRYLF
jgi:hypothetical protein